MLYSLICSVLPVKYCSATYSRKCRRLGALSRIPDWSTACSSCHSSSCLVPTSRSANAIVGNTPPNYGGAYYNHPKVSTKGHLNGVVNGINAHRKSSRRIFWSRVLHRPTLNISKPLAQMNSCRDGMPPVR